jgi:Ca2+-transporting ATPase
MVLASDAVVTDGRLVGDPTEGAFDAAYKLMATFHRMTDRSRHEVVRCYVKGAPDQLLARAATMYDADGGTVLVDDEPRGLYVEENRRLGEQGPRVLAAGRKDLDPLTFDPNGDLLAVIDGLELLGLIGIVDPPRPSAKGVHRFGEVGRDPGADDHRRSRGHGSGDR